MYDKSSIFVCLEKLWIDDSTSYKFLLIYNPVSSVDSTSKEVLLLQEPIPVTQLVRETATVMQEFTQSG